MMGNGLRPDVWMDFKQRFGVKRIAEFYGASEGNVSFANLLNKDCTVGMTFAEVTLVQYDVHNDEIVRDANGRCSEVPDGEPGLLRADHRNTVFEGYTDPEATEKIVRDVYEQGDAWFNSAISGQSKRVTPWLPPLSVRRPGGRYVSLEIGKCQHQRGW